MTGIFLFFILITVVLRFNYVQNVYSKNHEAFFYTHLRMDGLFTGALLGYLWHFRRNMLTPVYNKRRLSSFLILILVLPAIVLKTNNTFMLTFGFNLFHLGCALAILLMLMNENEKLPKKTSMLSKLKSMISLIGVYSYTIYLWHMPVQNILQRYIPNLFLESVIYILTSVIVGIGMSLLVEKPMLVLRDKYFPSK